MIWDMWKQGFAAWEQATAQYMEKVLTNPGVLGPAGAMLTAAMKTKTATDRALAAWWAMFGLPGVLWVASIALLLAACARWYPATAADPGPAWTRGERVLFVNSFTTHFTNFHTFENVRYGQDYAPGGSNLLNYLISRATIPEYQVRWRWRPNSIAIWDNRCTQHYAVMDYWPAVRKMERAGIVGDKPY